MARIRIVILLAPKIQNLGPAPAFLEDSGYNFLRGT